jgi:tripartite-type tricarboxylate transporter receptor subunit TctC
MKHFPALALLVVALVAGSGAQAQTYPSKPIRAVVAFGTGGATDVIARIVGAALSQQLGQPVVIDNRPGADGIVAGDQVAKAPADGHTVFFATSTQVSALPSLRKSLPFDPLEFTPIAGIGNFSFFWAVHPDVPARTLKELGEYGRANPGRLNAGSSSATATIAPTMLATAERFQLQVIPYKSETTALNDLISGRIQVMLITGTLAQHVRDGRARGLATLHAYRSKTLPGLPSMREAGMQPFPAVPWMGLFGPSKMPREIVDRLSRELAAVLQKPEVREQIERQAMDVSYVPAEALGTLAREQTDVWRSLTKAAGMTPE